MPRGCLSRFTGRLSIPTRCVARVTRIPYPITGSWHGAASSGTGNGGSAATASSLENSHHADRIDRRRGINGTPRSAVLHEPYQDTSTPAR